jgi:tetratricopeptide (TPR) repeat protein
MTLMSADQNKCEATFSLALHCHQAGNLHYAAQLYEQVLLAAPDHADSNHMLGVLASQMGRSDRAIMLLSRAVELKPESADYQSNLGLAYQAAGQLAEAITHYEKALKLRPDFPEAHTCLGNALHQRGKLDDAASHCREALRVRPDYPPAYVNLGSALLDQGKVDEAANCFRQALRRNPALSEAHNNLGTALTKHDNFDEAASCYREAIRHKPRYAEAHYNLGTVHQMTGHLDEALTCYEQALRSDSEFAMAHFNRALVWLLQGDWVKGWEEYEWRWAPHRSAKRHFEQPPWDGAELDGRTILLYAEQGLGDTIQFMRYVPMVRERGGRVIVECQPALSRFLGGCDGFDQLLVQGSKLPHFDVQAPLLSLPRMFGTTLASIPASVPYCHADAQLVEHWRKILLDIGKAFKVGIAWQGTPSYRHDRLRSIPLAHFEPLARLPGVTLISLQKGPGTEQLQAIAGKFTVVDLGGNLDETAGAFMDTAAVMKNLDLVISSDTAVAHLAGALGIPVWTALQFVPDWRWLLEREDSPWYPTMRLFRQTRHGDWDGVFNRVAEELNDMIHG